MLLNIKILKAMNGKKDIILKQTVHLKDNKNF